MKRFAILLSVLLFSNVFFGRIQAQAFLFNEIFAKSFILSKNFNNHGRIVNNPFKNDRLAFVESLPPSETWKWVRKGDSLSLQVILSQGESAAIIFKNDLQKFTGLDKKELGEQLTLHLQKSLKAVDSYNEMQIITKSLPIDSMYGFLYRFNFYDDKDIVNDLGIILRYLMLDNRDSINSERLNLRISQYGFKMDTLVVDISQINSVFGNQYWEYWYGTNESQQVLYCKNSLFNYAHLFYFDSKKATANSNLTIDVLPFIPLDNVSEIFKKNEPKTNKRLGIEIITN